MFSCFHCGHGTVVNPQVCRKKQIIFVLFKPNPPQFKQQLPGSTLTYRTYHSYVHAVFTWRYGCTHSAVLSTNEVVANLAKLFLSLQSLLSDCPWFLSHPASIPLGMAESCSCWSTMLDNACDSTRVGLRSALQRIRAKFVFDRSRLELHRVY